MDTIEKYSLQDPLCTWSDSTVVDDIWVLYDFSDCPNGYIYTLKTNGEDAGYIQIDSSNLNYNLNSYSYDGINIALSAISAFEEDMDCTVSLDEHNLYYGGAFSYALEYNGQLYNLLSHEIITTSKDELAEEFEVNVDTQASTTYSVLRSDGSTMVSGYNSFTLVEMDDFAGIYIYGGHNSLVANHCTPTAAFNVLRYFAARGYSDLLNTTDFATFRELYLKMNTNGVNSSTKTHDGTNWTVLHSDGYSGLLEYIEAHDVEIYDTDRYAMGAVSKPDLDTLKWLITSDCPVILTLKAFPSAASSGYHSVVMYGYKDSDIILSNGWDKTYHYYTYANLNVHQYYYVDFN